MSLKIVRRPGPLDPATLIVVVLSFGMCVSAQNPQAPVPPRDNNQAQSNFFGSVSGRVVGTENGEPLKRALMRLVGPGSGPTVLRDVPIVATDDEGRYEFNWLPPGSYRLTASKSGFVTLNYGQTRPGEAERPIQIVAGRAITGADFALARGGVIVTHLTDDLRNPMSGVLVRVLQRRFVNGESQLFPVAIAGASGVVTDSAGEARLHGLLPGDYYVLASSSTTGPSAFSEPAGAAGSGRMYAPTYYPGTIDYSEQRVTVRLGEPLDVNFPLVPVRPARISVTVRTSEGAQYAGAGVALDYRYPGGSGSRTLTAQGNGTFSVSNVLPGNYTLSVYPSTPNERLQEFASMPLPVNGTDVTGMAVTTGPGGTARGRIVFDTGAPPSNLQPGGIPVVPVTPITRDGFRPSRMQLANDWTFTVSGLSSPVVFRLNPAPAASMVSGPAAAGMSGWFVKAVMLNGRDITDVPLDFSDNRVVEGLEMIVTRTRTTLAGTAADDRGIPTQEFTAIVFPQNRNEWTPQSSRIAAGHRDQDGRFTIIGLPPGEYFVVAVDYLESGSERDPELLARLAEKATRVTLAEGESRTVRLTRSAF